MFSMRWRGRIALRITYQGRHAAMRDGGRELDVDEVAVYGDLGRRDDAQLFQGVWMLWIVYISNEV